jgi:hypothetical protein
VVFWSLIFLFEASIFCTIRHHQRHHQCHYCFQDATLRDQLKAGMSLRAYAAYPHQHHDWHGSATNRQAFYLTGLKIPSLSSASGNQVASRKGGGSAGAPLDSRGEARKVLLKAIVTLRNADFVGVMEDMGRLVRLLSCTLGVPPLEAPSSAMLRSVLGVDTLFARPTNDSDLVRKVENLNAIDMVKTSLYKQKKQHFSLRLCFHCALSYLFVTSNTCVVKLNVKMRALFTSSFSARFLSFTFVIFLSPNNISVLLSGLKCSPVCAS